MTKIKITVQKIRKFVDFSLNCRENLIVKYMKISVIFIENYVIFFSRW